MAISRLVKREMIITLSTILVIVVAFVGFSYSVFVDVDETTETVIEFGDISLSYVNTDAASTYGNVIGIQTNSSPIVYNLMYPQTDASGLTNDPYTFQLTNTGDYPLTVRISLSIDTSYIPKSLYSNYTPSNGSYIRYNLTKNNVSIATDNYNEHLHTTSLDPGQTQTFSLRMWLDEHAPNTALGTYFATNIECEYEYYPETSTAS